MQGEKKRGDAKGKKLLFPLAVTGRGNHQGPTQVHGACLALFDYSRQKAETTTGKQITKTGLPIGKKSG